MTYSRHLSPSDKARRTRLRTLASQAEQALNEAKDHAGVLAVFEALPRSFRGDVFWLLDNDHRTANHGLLRRVRNHTEDGPRLFALF